MAVRFVPHLFSLHRSGVGVRTRLSRLGTRLDHYISQAGKPYTPTALLPAATKQYTTDPRGSGLSAARLNRAVHEPAATTPVNSASRSVPVFACEKSAVQNVYQQHAAPHKERAFYVNDIGIVERQHARWVDELPRVRPFFAVKCCPDDVLLRVCNYLTL